MSNIYAIETTKQSTLFSENALADFGHAIHEMRAAFLNARFGSATEWLHEASRLATEICSPHARRLEA
jgi:hypothetical protein